MKRLGCCENCNVKNRLRCLFCEEYQQEEFDSLYNEYKKDKGCSTCKNCKRVNNFPGFVTAEECVCEEGLNCDTVLFAVKNCPKWVGIKEG